MARSCIVSAPPPRAYREESDQRYRAAGAKDNGQPGPRPDYMPTYYAAYIHDVNGNNIEVCHF